MPDYYTKPISDFGIENKSNYQDCQITSKSNGSIDYEYILL